MPTSVDLPEPALAEIDILRMAALTGSFDPLASQLAPLIRVLASASQEVLVSAAPQGETETPSYRWQLADEQRRRALDSLTSREQLDQVLEQAQQYGLSPKDGDVFGSALRMLLEQGLASAKQDNAAASQPEAWRRAILFLEGHPLLDRDAEGDGLADFRKKLEDQIAHNWRSSSVRQRLPKSLYGREDMVRELMEFAVPAPTDAGVREALVVGDPGIGRFAVLATVINKLRKQEPAPIVIQLDFNRPGLSANGFSYNLVTSEFLKQLGQELRSQGASARLVEAIATHRRGIAPNADEGLSEFEAAGGPWVSALAGALSALTSRYDRTEGTGEFTPPKAISIFADAVDSLKFGDGLKQFQRRWFGVIQSCTDIPCSLILSGGSAMVTGDFENHVDSSGLKPKLKDGTYLVRVPVLDEKSAIEFFRELRASTTKKEADQIDIEVARDAAAMTGGDPLLLVMLAGHRPDIEPAQLREEFRELGVSDAAQQPEQGSLLYRRILGRLPANLRLIAHPGLLLPELNAELVSAVLDRPQRDGDLSAKDFKLDEHKLAPTQEDIGRLQRSSWVVEWNYEGARPDVVDIRYRADVRGRWFHELVRDKELGFDVTELFADAAQFLQTQFESGQSAFADHLRQQVDRTKGLILALRLHAKAGEPLAERAEMENGAAGLVQWWYRELGLFTPAQRAAVLGLAGRPGTLDMTEVLALPEPYSDLRRDLVAEFKRRSYPAMTYERDVSASLDTPRRPKTGPNPASQLKPHPLPAADLRPGELANGILGAWTMGQFRIASAFWEELLNRWLKSSCPNTVQTLFARKSSIVTSFWADPLWLGALALLISGGKRRRIAVRRLVHSAWDGQVMPTEPMAARMALMRFLLIFTRGEGRTYADVGLETLESYLSQWGSDNSDLRTFDSRTYCLLDRSGVLPMLPWPARLSLQGAAVAGGINIPGMMPAGDGNGPLAAVPGQTADDIRRRHARVITPALDNDSVRQALSSPLLSPGARLEVRMLLRPIMEADPGTCLEVLRVLAPQTDNIALDVLNANRSDGLKMTELLVLLDRFGRLPVLVSALGAQLPVALRARLEAADMASKALDHILGRA